MKASISPQVSSGVKKDRKGLIKQVDMNILTFLKDNTIMKKHESSSSSESRSPKADRRHNNVVFKIQDETTNKANSKPQLETLQPNNNLWVGSRNSNVKPIRGVEFNELQVLSADDHRDRSPSQSSLNESGSSSGNLSARSRTSNFRAKANKSKLKGMFIHKRESGINRGDSRLAFVGQNKMTSFKANEKKVYSFKFFSGFSII